jgi:hypothetical protein
MIYRVLTQHKLGICFLQVLLDHRKDQDNIEVSFQQNKLKTQLMLSVWTICVNGLMSLEGRKKQVK